MRTVNICSAYLALFVPTYAQGVNCSVGASFCPRLKNGPWIRVAMVYIQTKNTNLGKFFRTLDWKMLDIFYAHWYLGYFMTISYILCSFGNFFPVLVSCIKKNLATLLWIWILSCHYQPCFLWQDFTRLCIQISSNRVLTTVQNTKLRQNCFTVLISALYT
jgi:hypothetical protein